MSQASDAGISTALAGGAISAALIDTLFEKGVLNLDEARGVLERAMKALAPVALTGNGAEAQRIIAGMMRGKFSARG